MNITLTVVVAAIVILITALVVITIFGSGIANVGTLVEAKTLCQTTFETTCRTSNAQPQAWRVNHQGTPTDCSGIVQCVCVDYHPTCQNAPGG